MATIGAFEAKNTLSKLLDRVAAGERITISRNGMPVAQLVPLARASSQSDVQQAIQELLAFRNAHPLDGVAIKELINEGRRF
jgi:prevent-host-death family protein